MGWTGMYLCICIKIVLIFRQHVNNLVGIKLMPQQLNKMSTDSFLEYNAGQDTKHSLRHFDRNLLTNHLKLSHEHDMENNENWEINCI